MAIKNLGRWSPTTPWLGAKKKTAADWPTYVCQNKSCKSYGKSHPNCKCGAPYAALQKEHPGEFHADGGEIHFCKQSGTHDPSCDHFADGGQIQANTEFEASPGLALDHSIVSHGLLHALTKSGHSKSDNLNKPTEDLIDHAHRGHRSLKSHAENHFNSKHEHPESHKDEISGLKNHLDSIRQNPEQLLDVGGFPGLPGHSAALGAKAAAASDYFDTIKPKQPLPGPLDPVMPPDKLAEQNYRRQLGIAEKPLSILNKVRNGTILPSDMQTLVAIYPDLAKSIQSQAFESLVSAKTKGIKISYAHKMGLGIVLGEPLDATMTPQAMQAIMKANAGAQTESQGMPQKKAGATAATQKTIAKVDDLYKTSLEKIQTEK